MASPAQYDFTGDGSTRIFPVASRIISQEYLKIEIDEEQVIDLTLYDVINNSIVFKTPPVNKSAITVRVAESIEGIAELDNLTITQIVADNILDVNTVAYNIEDVNTVADSIADVGTVAYAMTDVNTVAYNIVNVNNVGDNITEVVDVATNLEYIWNVEDNLAEVRDVSDNMSNVVLLGSNIDELLLGNAVGTLKGATIQVGRGLDFETLHEALRWAELSTFSNGGSLRIEVENDQALIADDEEPSPEGTYYEFRNCEIVITSLNKASSIYIPSASLYSTYFDSTIFKLSNATMTFDNINIDLEYDGASSVLTVTPIHATNGSTVNMLNGAVSGYKELRFEDSTLNLDTMFLISYDEYAFSCSNSSATMVNVTHDQVNFDFHLENNSSIVALVANQTTPILPSNVIPDTAFNKIDTDGSFFTDGSTALGGGGGGYDITVDTTYRVGFGLDFSSLQEVANWLPTVTASPDATLTFILEEEANELNVNDNFEEGFGLITIEDKNVIIRPSDSLIYYDYPVTIYPGEDTYYLPPYYYGYPDANHVMIKAKNSNVTLSNIVFDTSYYYSAMEGLDLMVADKNSNVVCTDVDVIGHNKIKAVGGSNISFDTSSIESLVSKFHIQAFDFSKVTLTDAIIDGVYTIDSLNNSQVILNNVVSNTTTPSDDKDLTTTPALNVIQGDGSFITDDVALLLTPPEIISENITKTVGSGKDFETLHLALRWAEKLIFTKNGFLYLSVDDGVHVLGGEGEFNEGEWAYYCFTHSKIIIEGASGVKENCIITQDSWDDGDNWGAMYSSYSSFIRFYKITIDFALGGYPYPDHTDVMWFSQGSYTFINECVIKNVATGCYSFDSSEVAVRNTTFDNCDVACYALSGTIQLETVTISNSNVGITVNISTTNSTVQLQGITFTTNTTDTNVPINEIQYNGSFISDNTGALSFKA